MQIEEAIKILNIASGKVKELYVYQDTLNLAIDTVLNELEKKDKVIDDMVGEIAFLNYECIREWCKKDKCENFKTDEYHRRKCDTNNLECIKEYFYKRVSDNK